MRIYYAHCMAIYNTPQEARDIALLDSLGFEVVNPNHPDIDKRCKAIRDEIAQYNRICISAKRDPSDEMMASIFKPLATIRCDALAFRALPDGRIPAGVAQEVEWARDYGHAILELPSNFTDRRMSLEVTREYLREVGQR